MIAAPKSSGAARVWVVSALLLASSVAVVGCEPGPGPAGEAIAELGAGATDFLSLADGEELVIDSGLQGGYHFVVHARARGIDPGNATLPGMPENPRTLFAAYREDGTQLSFDMPPHRLGYQATADDWLALGAGRILQLDITDPAEIDGESIVLVLDIEDRVGRLAQDERTIIATFAPL